MYKADPKVHLYICSKKIITHYIVPKIYKKNYSIHFPSLERILDLDDPFLADI
jgi:hypothetical protein